MQVPYAVIPACAGSGRPDNMVVKEKGIPASQEGCVLLCLSRRGHERTFHATLLDIFCVTLFDYSKSSPSLQPPVHSDVPSASSSVRADNVPVTPDPVITTSAHSSKAGDEPSFWMNDAGIDQNGAVGLATGSPGDLSFETADRVSRCESREEQAFDEHFDNASEVGSQHARSAGDCKPYQPGQQEIPLSVGRYYHWALYHCACFFYGTSLMVLECLVNC